MLLSGCADVESDSLGMEFARLGAGSSSGLGGICGDFGLLSEPVIDFNDGQYDLTLSVMDGRRPLSSGEDLTSCLSISRGELDSLNAAVASCVCAGEDDIRLPTTPIDVGLSKLGVSCGAGDADSCG